jgi:hypothetical protein
MAPSKLQSLGALLLLAHARLADVMWSPAGGHRFPTQGASVPRSALSSVECLRNRRKNSATPRPAGASQSFLGSNFRRIAEEENVPRGAPPGFFSNAKPVARPSDTRIAAVLKRGGVWSNRSQAAKRRWADPVYRETLLKKRRDNAAPARASRLVIGPVDSVVFSPSPVQSEIWRSKADEINAWARANQLRREAALRWRDDPIGATEARLESGAELRSRLDNTTYRLGLQEQRRERALKGWQSRRRNQAKRLQAIIANSSAAARRGGYAIDVGWPPERR